MSIAAMVLGILCIPTAFAACAGGWAILPAVFGLLGIVLAALGMIKEPAKKGMAIAGLVCALVGIIITVICFSCYCQAVKEIEAAMGMGMGELNELISALESLG